MSTTKLYLTVTRKFLAYFMLGVLLTACSALQKTSTDEVSVDNAPKIEDIPKDITIDTGGVKPSEPKPKTTIATLPKTTSKTPTKPVTKKTTKTKAAQNNDGDDEDEEDTPPPPPKKPKRKPVVAREEEPEPKPVERAAPAPRPVVKPKAPAGGSANPFSVFQ